MTPRDDIPAEIERAAKAMREVDRLASDRPAHEGLHWYRQMAVAAFASRAPEPAAGVEEIATKLVVISNYANAMAGKYHDDLRCSTIVTLCSQIAALLSHAPDEERIRREAAENERDRLYMLAGKECAANDGQGEACQAAWWLIDNGALSLSDRARKRAQNAGDAA